MSGFDLLPHFENPYPGKHYTEFSPPPSSFATSASFPFDDDDDGSEDAPKCIPPVVAGYFEALPELTWPSTCNREWIVPGGNHVTIEVFHWDPSCEAAECCGVGWMP
ncbi:hypothetical protein JCM21900_000167 [Sporobolomyces salmonicolor]